MARKSQFKKNLILPIFSKKNRGVSTIVVTIILIAISMIAVSIVWGVINNMVKNQIKNSQSCFGNYDKVQINEQYTCYVPVAGSPGTYNLRFSLEVGDIEIDKITVGVSSEQEVKGYEITNVPQTISGLSKYPGDSSNIILPEKNSGLSYQTTDVFHSEINLIQIAPVINGVQCEVSDSISQIENCNWMYD